MSTSDLLSSIYGEVEAKPTGEFPNITKLIYEGIEEVAKNSWKEEGNHYYRVKGFNPSSISGRKCPQYYAHTVINKDKMYSKISPELQLIFDLGNAVHANFQHYLRKHLYGTWKCMSCKKDININTKYFEHVKKHAPKAFVDRLKSNMHSHSTKPIPYADECPSCGKKNTLTYAEWKSINEDGLLAKVDGLLKYYKNFVALEFKSSASFVFKTLSVDKNPVRKAIIQLGHSMYETGCELGVVVFVDVANKTFRQFPVSLKDIKKEVTEERKVMEKAKKMVEKGFSDTPKKHAECVKCEARDRVCFPK